MQCISNTSIIVSLWSAARTHSGRPKREASAVGGVVSKFIQWQGRAYRGRSATACYRAPQSASVETAPPTYLISGAAMGAGGALRGPVSLAGRDADRPGLRGSARGNPPGTATGPEEHARRTAAKIRHPKTAAAQEPADAGPAGARWQPVRRTAVTEQPGADSSAPSWCPDPPPGNTPAGQIQRRHQWGVSRPSSSSGKREPTETDRPRGAILLANLGRTTKRPLLA